MNHPQSSHSNQREPVEAVVGDIRLESRAGTAARWHLSLEPSIFVGGDAAASFATEHSATPRVGTLEAVARSGARLEVIILELVEQDGITWCVVDKPLLEGTVVRVHIANTAAL